MAKGPNDVTNENINAETLVIKKPPMLDHDWKTNHCKKKYFKKAMPLSFS